MGKTVTEDAVRTALDSAYGNGYRDFLMGEAEAVAADLLDYDGAFSGCEVADVLPWIKSWQRLHT